MKINRKVTTALVAGAISCIGFAMSTIPASAAPCSLFKSNGITTGMCGSKPYFSTEVGGQEFGTIGRTPFSLRDFGNGYSSGFYGNKPLSCMGSGVFRNCW